MVPATASVVAAVPRTTPQLCYAGVVAAVLNTVFQGVVFLGRW
ncbi:MULTISPECIES: hypothetical protein [Kitasatospora]